MLKKVLSMDTTWYITETKHSEQYRMVQLSHMYARVTVSSHIADTSDSIARASNRKRYIWHKNNTTTYREAKTISSMAGSPLEWLVGGRVVSHFSGRRCFHDEQYHSRQVSKYNGSLVVLLWCTIHDVTNVQWHPRSTHVWLLCRARISCTEIDKVSFQYTQTPQRNFERSIKSTK